MAQLKEEVQTFIVTRLACFETPSRVVELVKEEFNGLEVSRQQVQTYDATRAGKKPAARWVTLFTATRKRFLEDVGEIPIAHRSVRLSRIERMYHAAEEMGNLPLAAQLLEQVAKEVGNAFTNRRELTGKNGGPIETDDVSKLTPEQRAERTAAMLAAARERKAAGLPPSAS